MTFRATLQVYGKTATGIEVPAEVVEALGAGKKPKVLATLNGYTYRSSVAVRHGVYMLPMSAEHRTSAQVQGGEEVTVRLALDTEAREVAVPADLQAALAQDAAAQRRFEGESDPGDEAVVYAIASAKHDVKGTLVNGYGVSSAALGADMVKALRENTAAAGE